MRDVRQMIDTNFIAITYDYSRIALGPRPWLILSIKSVAKESYGDGTVERGKIFSNFKERIGEFYLAISESLLFNFLSVIVCVITHFWLGSLDINFCLMNWWFSFFYLSFCLVCQSVCLSPVFQLLIYLFLSQSVNYLCIGLLNLCLNRAHFCRLWPSGNHCPNWGHWPLISPNGFLISLTYHGHFENIWPVTAIFENLWQVTAIFEDLWPITAISESLTNQSRLWKPLTNHSRLWKPSTNHSSFWRPSTNHSHFWKSLTNCNYFWRSWPLTKLARLQM